jgi:glycosyltransferase involved in cell wall biosynthesis
VVVDWIEVWSREYWREYLGRLGGAVGEAVQKLCMRVPQRAFCFSRLQRAHLQEGGLRGAVTIVDGLFDGEPPAEFAEAEPLVVYAGRQIPEKRAPSVVPAIALARADIPELRGIVFGDGPDYERVREAIASAGLQDAVDAPGFVGSEQVESAIRRALCLVLPSRREGYGLVVVEALAAGTPAVVVRGADNAATELVEDGVNGFMAGSAAPEDLADAIVRVHRAGPALRASTRDWYARNARRLSLDASLATVAAAYARRASC